MIILLFGPPGCGKGTQATLIASRFNIPAISTGEMFRAECKAGTELGKACSVISKGGLVSDDIVNEIVASRIAKSDCVSGFLLDGYPRTVAQARFFSALLAGRGLPRPVIVHLDVPAAALVARLTARRQCPSCKRIYNVVSQPPRSEGVCDDDGAALICRDDDREEVILRRLQAYQEQTGPILAWYGEPNCIRIDGNRPPAKVSEDVRAQLDRALSEPVSATA